jgi:glycosyltransferase involved in cell wall biosynthesis
MKKALVHNPYWDTLGGGEKYSAHVIEVLKRHQYQVHVQWHSPDLIDQINQRYHLKLQPVTIDSERETRSLYQRYRYQRQFDLIFWVSDGSLPLLFGQKNILHFQVPFISIPGNQLIHAIKRKSLKHVICNSRFTKGIIDSTLGIKSAVVYPPATMMIPGKKQNLIISVGRFDNLMQSKRQDILIEAFKKLDSPGWRLVLAGGVLHGQSEVNRLKSLAKGAAIDILTNPDFNTISTLYSQASVYWHAAGYGVDAIKEPEKVEHFGITTVEAMSAGAIPVVYGAGGQTEIVTHAKNGFIWHTIPELIDLTQTLIKNRPDHVSKAAITTAQQYNERAFEHELSRYIG